MSTRSNSNRFFPLVNGSSLEARLLCTRTPLSQDSARFAEVSYSKYVTENGLDDENPIHSVSEIHAASRTARPGLTSNLPVHVAKWPSTRPSVPKIVPARNASRTVMPTILPARMTASSTMQVEGNWSVRVTSQTGGITRSVVVSVPVPAVVQSTDTYSALPLFDDSAFGWLKGQRLAGVSAQEGVISGALDPFTVVVRFASSDSANDSQGTTSEGASSDIELIRGIDYEIDPIWGTIGRLAGGRIGENDAVTVTYRHAVRRLDAVILQADGQVVVRSGVPSNESPVSPDPGDGEKLLGRIFHSEFQAGLTANDLYPVLSSDPVSMPVDRSETIASLMPQVIRKLKSGRELRILAWGDSVTDGQYLGASVSKRWQDQFVTMLKRIYPRARISLVTEAWPGHGTGDYLAPGLNGSNRFEAAVLGARPDLVISEFVNDGYLTEPETMSQYGQILDAFRNAGIGWIVMTPHFTHSEFMGFAPGDPGGSESRPYVAALKAFAANEEIPVADASAIWGDMKRQGLPYVSLLSNGINHPNGAGLRLYAEALKMLFAK